MIQCDSGSIQTTQFIHALTHRHTIQTHYTPAVIPMYAVALIDICTSSAAPRFSAGVLRMIYAGTKLTQLAITVVLSLEHSLIIV